MRAPRHPSQHPAVFAAILCALAWSAPAARAATDAADIREARALIQRMNTALAQRNYVGTLRHQRGERAETLRVIHRVRGAEVAERIVPLDGSRREFIRRGPELTTILPDQGVALVERRPRAGGLLNTFPQIDERAAQLYDIAAVRRVRQQGRDTRLVTLEPRDGFRYGYRAWIDERTGMPIKTELRDADGRLLEEVAFTELRLLADIPDADFQPAVATDKLRWLRSVPVPGALVARGEAPEWVAPRMPPGFRLTQRTRQNLPGVSGTVEHLVFSDGVASVSVFIGARSEPLPTVSARNTPPGEGATTAFSVRVDGRPVTVVGEVPMRTARFIGLQLRSAGVPPSAPSPSAPPPAAPLPPR